MELATIPANFDIPDFPSSCSIIATVLLTVPARTLLYYVPYVRKAVAGECKLNRSMKSLPANLSVQLRVLVRTGRRVERLQRLPDGTIVVDIRERPVDGRANVAMGALIARTGGVSKSSVVLLSGHTSRHKTVSVPKSCYDRLRTILPVADYHGQ